MSEFLTKTYENFISSQEANQILEYCQTTTNWRPIPDSFWHDRTINYLVAKDEKIGQILKNIILNIQKVIIKDYSQQTYPDTMDIVRWFPGTQQTPHCDDMSDSIHRQDFAHRLFGCVLCLNDNYKGGETYYPEHNYKVTPKQGTLVIHPGDCDHRHGVTQIENNIRYTIASFWTLNINKIIDPDLIK